MVRSLVGALLGVGEGRRDESWPAEVLAARTREAARRDGVGAAPLCPPQGLTLDHVAYPPDEELAAWAARTRTLRQPLPATARGDDRTPGGGSRAQITPPGPASR